MRINIRRQTWIKSVSYALLFFALLLFSKSFFACALARLCRALAVAWRVCRACALRGCALFRAFCGDFRRFGGVYGTRRANGVSAFVCSVRFTLFLFVRARFCAEFFCMALLYVRRAFALRAGRAFLSHCALGYARLCVFAGSTAHAFGFADFFDSLVSDLFMDKKKTTREGYA